MKLVKEIRFTETRQNRPDRALVRSILAEHDQPIRLVALCWLIIDFGNVLGQQTDVSVFVLDEDLLCDVLWFGAGRRAAVRHCTCWATKFLWKRSENGTSSELSDQDILFMSGFAQSAGSDDFIQDEIIDFLQKPFTNTMFGQRVRTLLDGRVADSAQPS
jgi:hypothetical protein